VSLQRFRSNRPQTLVPTRVQGEIDTRTRRTSEVRIAGQGAASGLTDLRPEQLALFDQLQLDTPTREPFDSPL
jgi:hypothetical protein